MSTPAESTPAESIASLGSRLTDAADRETYAALISYADSLPPNDEFQKLVQLLGFHTLLTQRIPDAVRELTKELNELPQRLSTDASEIEGATRSLKSVSEQVGSTIAMLNTQAKGITATIATELATLQTAASRLQRRNTELLVEARETSWIAKTMALSITLLLGIVIGMLISIRG